MAEGPTCAGVLAQTLRASGVTRVFGHPGGEVMDVIDALEAHGVRFQLSGHESAAAFMAGAVGRMTGKPGVCLTTLGPGACNLVLGVASAYLDRDGLIAISARSSEEHCRLNAKQNLRLNELFVPITKASIALDGMDTSGVVCRALRVAATPPRGPVFLSLPSDLAAKPEKNGLRTQSFPPAPSPSSDSLDMIRKALNSAARPIGVIGIALDATGDCEAVRNFFLETGIPYASMPQAKGVGDEDGDGYLGSVGAGAADDFILEWLNRSDCLLGVGFDPVESSDNWHIRRPVYSVANSTIRFGNYTPAAECVGEVTPLLEQLLSGYAGRTTWDAREIEEVRRRTRALMCPKAERGPDGLSPYHVVNTLRHALPAETIVTADVGAHKMLLTQAWHTPEPGTFLISNGLSAMGYGVPTAIAASLLYPDTPVAGIIGDGGFGMMVQELETARRLGVKPLFVVFRDHSLSIIKLAQKARGMAEVGVDFGPVDWARVAEGFGAMALTPETLDGVAGGVEQWLACRKLTVLVVPVDPDLYSGLRY